MKQLKPHVAALFQTAGTVDPLDEHRDEVVDMQHYRTHLTARERSEIVNLSQHVRCMSRLGKMLGGVTIETLDRIVCWRRRARPDTIARVRAGLARRRVVVHVMEGVH